MSVEGFLLKHSMFRSKKNHLQLIVKEDCEIDIETISRYFKKCVDLFEDKSSFYVLSLPGTYWRRIN